MSKEPNIFGLIEYLRHDLFIDITDAVRKADRFYIMTEADVVLKEQKDLLAERDAAIAELKQKLEDVQASAYAESVDAGMRERRLRRALWLARTNSAEGQFFYWRARFGVESGFTKADIRGYSVNTKRRLRTNGEWIEYWKNVKSKCLKKAEEYK